MSKSVVFQSFVVISMLNDNHMKCKILFNEWIDISLNLLSRIVGRWPFVYVQLFDANSEFSNIAAFLMQFML